MDLYCRKVCARVKQPDGHYGPAVWALVGAGPEDQERIAKAPDKALKTSIVAPRDGGRHRYLMKLFAIAHQALPETWPAMSYDTFRHALMIDAGFYDKATVPDPRFISGCRIERIPWSLEYAAMDDTRHKEVVAGIIKCLVTKWIPGLDSAAFEGEVLEALR